jgi:phosphate transport system substrate-binding protein
MQNRAGQLVQPDEETFAAAASNARWDKAPGFYELLTDQPGAKSWPMTAASFILLHKVPPDSAKTAAVLAFFDWAFKNGGPMASELDYVAMPASVVRLIQSAWRTQVKTASGEVVWNR